MHGLSWLKRWHCLLDCFTPIPIFPIKG